MLNYLVFGIALIIFVIVIVITGKAIGRGIEAKQNQKMYLMKMNKIRMKNILIIQNLYQVPI